MGHSGEMIGNAASMGTRYMQRLVKDVPVDRFARFAAPGGAAVVANHPAFALGHLCLYPKKVLELLGQDASSVQPPPEFETLFSKDAACQDDAQGKLYPARDEIVSFFEKSYSAAYEAIQSASDEQLNAPNPVDTPMKEVCPTLGSLLNFYLTSHVMIHLGQVSTWRRMEGLAPA